MELLLTVHWPEHVTCPPCPRAQEVRGSRVTKRGYLVESTDPRYTLRLLADFQAVFLHPCFLPDWEGGIPEGRRHLESTAKCSCRTAQILASVASCLRNFRRVMSLLWSSVSSSVKWGDDNSTNFRGSLSGWKSSHVQGTLNVACGR